MNGWYFTFEFPPTFGGGLSTYMKTICDAYIQRPESRAVIFTLDPTQNGLMSLRHLHENVTLVSLNINAFTEKEDLGHWVAVSRLFQKTADLLLMQIESGSLPTMLRPDFMEFADGFGIGAITIQQKLCLNSDFLDIPILVNLHTPTYLIDRMNQLPVYQLPRFLTAHMELQALLGADMVLAPSQAIIDVIQEEFAKTGVQLETVDVTPNPFPKPIPDAPLPVEDITYDHFYIASRLTHWKGIENAINAMSILWDRGVSVPLLIYGEDTFFAAANLKYSAYLKKKFSKYFDKDLIQIKGKTSRKEIDQAAKTAYAQIHPSHFDNFPYSILEAMSQGTICLAGVNGGIREISENGEGLFLTDVQNFKEFSEAIDHIMMLTSDERYQISHRAKEIIRRRCDPIQYIAHKEDIVRKLTSKPRPQRAVFPFLAPPDSSCIQEVMSSKPDEPELSVVIPYYNMGAFIDDTLSSVLKSTCKNIEIILVNDGSTDPESLSKLETLHRDHNIDQKHLKILTIPNGGVANARNTGVKAAHASIITLLDADDRVGARYYEKAIRILRHYDNVSFVGSWIEDFNVSGRIRYWATWNAEPPLQLVMNQTNCQSLVYKRDAFLQHGQHDPDLRMFLDDWDGVISLIASGHRGVMIPEPLFEYRIRPNSIFRSTGALWDINYEKIVMKHRDIYNAWGADIAAFLNVNGPNNFYHIAGKPSTLRK